MPGPCLDKIPPTMGFGSQQWKKEPTDLGGSNFNPVVLGSEKVNGIHVPGQYPGLKNPYPAPWAKKWILARLGPVRTKLGPTLTKPLQDRGVPHRSSGRRFERAGLLATEELDKALEKSKAEVAHIAKECRLKNRKFRSSIEFDRENFLHGLSGWTFSPRCLVWCRYPWEATVLRWWGQLERYWSQVRFKAMDHTLLAGGGQDAEIHLSLLGPESKSLWQLNTHLEGSINNSILLTSLSLTIVYVLGSDILQRDDQVDMYVFAVSRDMRWVGIMIVDLLYTSIPKYEELNGAERLLYHNEKAGSTASACGSNEYSAESLKILPILGQRRRLMCYIWNNHVSGPCGSSRLPKVIQLGSHPQFVLIST
ncbi:hypothetical protein B0H12DRAFT_1079068 [Mycena haematopus]|nr:hypothetical protein B0H12DRAFT_1079068 [Mycena haematopus]